MLVDLHSHLEGRVRPSTAAELAAAGGVPQPEGGWERAIQLDGPADLTVYLAKVASTYPFFRSLEATRRIAREAVQDAAAAGLDYLELRFGPATHAEDERGIDAVIQAVIDGMREASDETGMPSGAVVAALRHHDEATNLAVARAAARWAAGRGRRLRSRWRRVAVPGAGSRTAGPSTWRERPGSASPVTPRRPAPRRRRTRGRRVARRDAHRPRRPHRRRP